MKIGFDAKRAFHNRTGLGNYSRTLIQHLRFYYPDEEYRYFTPDDHSSYSDLFRSENIIKPGRKDPLWRSFGIKRDIRSSGINLYHGLSNELPFGIQKTGIPSVVTIHDVIFDIVKEDFPWHDRLVYRLKTKKCIRESSVIIAISEATKRDLIERFGAPYEKVKVIYQPIDDQFNQKEYSDEKLKKIKSEYELPDQFLLYVGALMKRKNVLPMIKAWEILPEQEKVPLYIFGSGNQYKNSVIDYVQMKRLDQKVHLRAPVPFDHLPALYRLAESVLYPSLYEGFGLPVLEALACGAKVVTSSVSSMPEAGGELPIYVEPDDVDSISEGISLSMQQSRPDPVNLSSHLDQFDSAGTTEQVMNLYNDLIGK